VQQRTLCNTIEDLLTCKCETIVSSRCEKTFSQPFREKAEAGRCVAVCCSAWQRVVECGRVCQSVAECGSVLQCVAVCCSVLPRVAVWCSVVAAWFSVLSRGMSHK